VAAYLGRRAPWDVAEDLAAETFVKALAALQAGRGPSSSVSGWLFRIAHNLLIDYYRRRDRGTESTLDETTPAGERTEDAALRSLRSAWLWQSLGRLTADQAMVVELRLAGYGFLEIGEAMGKSPGAVKALLHRATVTLRMWGGQWQAM